MGYFAKVVHRITMIATFIGSGALVAIMLLVVANIIVRVAGATVPGTWELVEHIMVISVGFAIVYTALRGGHVTIKLLVSRLPSRAQAFLGNFFAVMCIGILTAMAWAMVWWIRRMAAIGIERTDYLQMPISPYKKIWLSALLICCLVILMDLFKNRVAKQGNEK